MAQRPSSVSTNQQKKEYERHKRNLYLLSSVVVFIGAGSIYLVYHLRQENLYIFSDQNARGVNQDEIKKTIVEWSDFLKAWLLYLVGLVIVVFAGLRVMAELRFHRPPKFLKERSQYDELYKAEQAVRKDQSFENFEKYLDARADLLDEARKTLSAAEVERIEKELDSRLALIYHIPSKYRLSVMDFENYKFYHYFQRMKTYTKSNMDTVVVSHGNMSLAYFRRKIQEGGKYDTVHNQKVLGTINKELIDINRKLGMPINEFLANQE